MSSLLNFLSFFNCWCVILLIFVHLLYDAVGRRRGGNYVNAARTIRFASARILTSADRKNFLFRIFNFWRMNNNNGYMAVSGCFYWAILNDNSSSNYWRCWINDDELFRWLLILNDNGCSLGVYSRWNSCGRLIASYNDGDLMGIFHSW